MKRLISIAKLHYRKNIVKCPCGHICNGVKPPAAKPKPIINKIVKVTETKTEEISEVTITNVLSNTSEITVAPKITTSTFHPQVQMTSTPLFRIPNAPNDMLRAQLDVSCKLHSQPKILIKFFVVHTTLKTALL